MIMWNFILSMRKCLLNLYKKEKQAHWAQEIVAKYWTRQEFQKVLGSSFQRFTGDACFYRLRFHQCIHVAQQSETVPNNGEGSTVFTSITLTYNAYNCGWWPKAASDVIINNNNNNNLICIAPVCAKRLQWHWLLMARRLDSESQKMANCFMFGTSNNIKRGYEQPVLLWRCLDPSVCLFVTSNYFLCCFHKSSQIFNCLISYTTVTNADTPDI